MRSEYIGIKNVIVSGHRGERVHKTENTMTAFKSAIAAGCEMLETDVHMTKDGRLVLMHDENVERTTDGKGIIRNLTFEEIKSLNALIYSEPRLSPEAPPALSELLTLAQDTPGLLLNIELKDYPEPGQEAFAYECADKTCDMIIEYGLSDRVWINSFSGKLLEYVWKKYGRTFKYHGFYPWFILGPMDTDPEEFIDIACMQHRYVNENGEVIKYDEPMCPKEWFDYLISKGIMPLMAPSLSDIEKLDLSVQYGSRMINTDDPVTVVNHYRKLGLLK
ncbi:MAG: hypothetical protein MJ059_05725 [Lachnospiraceae bacterium]|nr:hypothetical protein [Lachnospiraceae bacterium]